VKLQGQDKYRRLLGGPPDTAGMKSGYVQLGPGCSVGPHSTGRREEAVVILEGEAEVSFEDHPVIRAGEGMLVYVPADCGHDVKNTGEGILRYVYVVAPVL